jgi:hypothetical protein
LKHLSISTSHDLAYSTRLSDVNRMDSPEKSKATMDFSVLRTLRIGDSLSAFNVRWLTEECRFPSLDSLDLDLWDVYNEYEMENRFKSFLLSLRPLRSLNYVDVTFLTPCLLYLTVQNTHYGAFTCSCQDNLTIVVSIPLLTCGHPRIQT